MDKVDGFYCLDRNANLLCKLPKSKISEVFVLQANGDETPHFREREPD